ncbi:hypothetical protein N0V93_000544 [Gnomoniopsis smithogilvyi]|uniref:Uncharacterized protein n=1 Tax=Gnomoniopsis smithogilvyi TaxID=1191159 RepID=A0A9W8Z2E3_9PEZI|nr:hypothetical protein N0V93_000544 [Gnomoniopsis smithogilvyi]
MGDATNPPYPKHGALQHYATALTEALRKAVKLTSDAEPQIASLHKKIQEEEAEIEQLREKLRAVQTSQDQHQRELSELNLALRNQIDSESSVALQILKPEILDSYPASPDFASPERRVSEAQPLSDSVEESLPDGSGELDTKQTPSYITTGCTGLADQCIFEPI